MAKIVGSFFLTAGAVGLGSLMVIPIMAIAVMATIGDGIGRFWPWLVVLLVYGGMLAFVVKAVVEPRPQILVAIGGVLPPIFILLSNTSDSWTTRLAVAFVAIVSFGLASTTSVHIMQQKAAAIGSIQLLWIAPAVYTCYGCEAGQPNMLALLTTVLGIIATFFATDM